MIGILGLPLWAMLAVKGIERLFAQRRPEDYDPQIR